MGPYTLLYVTGNATMQVRDRLAVSTSISTSSSSSSSTSKIKKPNGATLLMRKTDEGVVTDAAAEVAQTVLGVTFRFLAGEFFQNNLFLLPVTNCTALSRILFCAILINLFSF